MDVKSGLVVMVQLNDSVFEFSCWPRNLLVVNISKIGLGCGINLVEFSIYISHTLLWNNSYFTVGSPIISIAVYSASSCSKIYNETTEHLFDQVIERHRLSATDKWEVTKSPPGGSWTPRNGGSTSLGIQPPNLKYQNDQIVCSKREAKLPDARKTG